MRILHVIPSVASGDGGPSVAVIGMCRALRSGGADARIATTNADGSNALPVPLERETVFSDVPTTFFAREGGAGFKRSPALAQWLDAHVATFDLVHVHAVFSHASMAAARACQARDVPYIVRPLGTLDPWSLAQKRWRKRVLRVAGVNRMLERAAAIHFTTREEQRRAPAVAQVRGVVVPLGLEDAAFAAAPVPYAARETNIVTFTRLHPKKNLETLIDAFGALGAGAAGWRLTIAGDGDARYRAQLHERAVQSRAADRITFAGWVSGAAKDDVLGRAALFALPSRQENFGLSVLEALAHGTPVLISREVNLADAVDEAAAGWIANDDGEFTRMLADVIAADAERARRAAHARTLAEHYRWPAIAEFLSTLYATLIAARAAAHRG